MIEKQTSTRRKVDQKRYQFEATVNITHILTTLGMIVALFSWGTDIKNRLVQHEVEITHIKASTQSSSKDVRESLREINAKVDRLIERNSR